MVARGGLSFAIDPWCSAIEEVLETAPISATRRSAQGRCVFIYESAEVGGCVDGQVKSYCRQLPASSTVEDGPWRRQ